MKRTSCSCDKNNFEEYPTFEALPEILILLGEIDDDDENFKRYFT